MNLQDLVYFHHLADNLSFTATANHFFISQPSISMALKRLESELETTLIDRRKTLKKMQLTPAGELLRQGASEIIETLEVTQQAIRDIRLETVYYGFLPTIGGYFLPKILPKIDRFTKSLKFIEEESSDIMLKLVLQEKVPIAILGHDTPYILHNRIKQVFLKEEELALWVSDNHPFAQRKSVRPEEVKNQVFISLSEDYTHQRIFAKWALENQIIEPNIVYAKEIKTVLSIAASTQMVAFMTDILVDDRANLIKVPLENAPKFYVSLILNTEAEHSYVQQEFNQAVLDVIQNDFSD